MKITIFNGSPRGANGNTQVMVEAFAEGAKSAGAEVETVLLADKKFSGGGAILKDAPMMLKPIVLNYKRLLKQAGREVVVSGRPSEQLKAKLEKPLIPAEQYIAAANKIFDAELAKNKAT